jgi:hypothetical protein
MALRPLLDADIIYEQHPVVGEDTFELFETIEDSFGVELGDYRALCGLTITELASEVSKKAGAPFMTVSPSWVGLQPRSLQENRTHFSTGFLDTPSTIKKRPKQSPASCPNRTRTGPDLEPAKAQGE